MGYVIGVALGVAVCIFGRYAGFDRDRAYYATVLVVVAHYYVLFAVMGGSMHALALESIVMCVFATAAVLGFRLNAWLVVAGLAGHGVMDGFHSYIVSNPGMPVWWPPFCLAFDISAAICLAWLLTSSRAPGLPESAA